MSLTIQSAHEYIYLDNNKFKIKIINDSGEPLKKWSDKKASKIGQLVRAILTEQYKNGNFTEQNLNRVTLTNIDIAATGGPTMMLTNNAMQIMRTLLTKQLDVNGVTITFERVTTPPEVTITNERKIALANGEAFTLTLKKTKIGVPITENEPLNAARHLIQHFLLKDPQFNPETLTVKGDTVYLGTEPVKEKVCTSWAKQITKGEPEAARFVFHKPSKTKKEGGILKKPKVKEVNLDRAIAELGDLIKDMQNF